MRKAGLALIAFLGLLGAWAFASRSEGERSDSTPRFRTEVVQRGPVVASVSATGTVTPSATVIVGSQLSGQVVEILAEHNSQVKAGQVMARLNRDTLLARRDAARADLAQARANRLLVDAQAEKTRADRARAEALRRDAEAQLARAETLLADAETTLERQSRLSARGIASEAALQSATTQRNSQRSARASAVAQIASTGAQIASLDAELKINEAQKAAGDAQVARTEALVRQIEVDLANSEIRSPVDGVVIQRNVELGQAVAASLQAPTLFLVAEDLRRIDVYVNLDEADVGRVREGQTVEFTVTAHPARTFRGQIKQVRLGSQNVQNVVIYTAVVEVENADLALLPGMTANLRVFTERRANVLRVPNAALRWQPPGAVRPAGADPASAPVPSEPVEDPAGPFSAPAGGGNGAPNSPQARQLAAMLDAYKADLGLTPEQDREMRALAQVMRQNVLAAGADPASRREAFRAERQRFNRAFEALLTTEQQEKLRAGRRAQRMARQGGNGERGVPGRLHVLDERGLPRAVAVRIGATDGNRTEINSGEINEGEKVVVGTAASGRAAPRTGGAFRFGF